MKPEEFREELIQRIKDIGQEIIDRADDIAGTSEFRHDLSIHSYLSMCGEKIDTIEWHTEVAVKGHIDRLMRKIY